MKISAASRESKLAVIQAEILLDNLKEYFPENEYELLTFKTTGDKILDRTLDKIGGKGLFVKELEEALLNGNADLTVHSLKDVTMDVNPEIPLAAFSKREDPRDALILPVKKAEIDFSKPVGTSSRRRFMQLKSLFPNAEFKPLRGNVQTRLRKLDEGEYSAIILAVSGLKRSGLESRISRIFSEDEIIPAVGQGVLTVQARKDFDTSLLKYFNDVESEICARTERAFARKLNGGCSAPLGAYAKIEDEDLILRYFFADDRGRTFKGLEKGKVDSPEELGKSAAMKILKEIYG